MVGRWWCGGPNAEARIWKRTREERVVELVEEHAIFDEAFPTFDSRPVAPSFTEHRRNDVVAKPRTAACAAAAAVATGPAAVAAVAVAVGCGDVEL